MRKVVVNEWMSLDGVVQAPGAPDEDRSGGFEHGGWHQRYFDDLSQKQALENIVEAGGFLLGRRAYDVFASYWPNAPEEEQIIAEPLNTKPKYVASTTLSERRVARISAALAKRGWRKRPAVRGAAQATTVSTGDQRRSA
jgi:dihydrofolate reductase